MKKPRDTSVLDEAMAHYDPTDPLLSASEAAKRLGVAAGTIRRWIREGAIVFVSIGPHKRKRVRLSVVAQQIGEEQRAV